MNRLSCIFLLVWLIAGCSSVTVQQPVKHFPVAKGEVGPVAADNPLQFPFSCTTEEAGLGKPLVDNQQGRGQPVYGDWLFFTYKQGYSEFCGSPMQVQYFYRSGADKFVALDAAKTDLPPDMTYIEFSGEQIPFIVRFERGVINRFIYGISSLVRWPLAETPAQEVLWNRNLILLFNGGIGIGFHQSGLSSINLVGDVAPQAEKAFGLFNPDLLSRGFVLAGSTGMGTDTSFNIPLLSQTAAMLKEQVVSEIGQPDLTLGMGGSGGSIQQFYNSKVRPDLFDGMVVSHMFPDLLTQITGVGDCELLQYYFDRNASGNESGFWRSWEHRGLVEGFNAVDGYQSRYSTDGTGRPFLANAEPGSSVCVDGWRGITPVMFNPKMFLPFFDMHYGWFRDHPEVLKDNHWTHWDDASAIYGINQQGYANRTYDNVGVQYGLKALQAGQITVDQFLDLNARIGGWKPSSQMQLEQAPFYPYGSFAIGKYSLWSIARGNVKLTSLSQLLDGTRNLLPLLPDGKMPPWLINSLGKDDRQSPWSHHNATASQMEVIAPRSEASPQALVAAERANMVFAGALTKPTISLLIYQDHTLDIHDARQSFVFRKRMAEAGADPALFSVWGLMPSGNLDSDLKQLGVIALQAVETMQQWLQAGDKPAGAEDRCWDADYALVAMGDKQVWNGQLPDDPSEPGQCTPLYPIHASPRVAAGEPFVAKLLKCPLKPVSTALQDGTYAHVSFTPAQQAYLQQIFTTGVCDY